MAKVYPWHAEGSDVYHDCTNCTEGNNIESGNRVQGTGNNRRCSHCSDLDASGGC